VARGTIPENALQGAKRGSPAAFPPASPAPREPVLPEQAEIGFEIQEIALPGTLRPRQERLALYPRMPD
jgi:hypothetical protein